MFATISTRIEPLQQYLTLTTQRKFGEFPANGTLARARPRLQMAQLDLRAPERQLQALSPMGADPVLPIVLLPEMPAQGERASFAIAGLLMRSVRFDQAHPMRQVPFRANLQGPGFPLTRVVESQTFSVGIEISCSVDVLINRTDENRDARAVFVATFSWLLGANERGPLFLGAGGLSPSPHSMLIATFDSPGGVAIPASLSSGSPLAAAFADLVPPVRGALQAALLDLPKVVASLVPILPNGGRPVNDALFLTGRVGGPISPTEPGVQLRYAAQIIEQVSNDQARVAWRRMLVDRPEAEIPANRDLVVETSGTLLAEGILPALRVGVTQGFSTMLRGIWKRTYFEEARLRALPAAAQTAAGQQLVRFRGDPGAMSGQWFDAILEPWGGIVRAVAASRLDTEGLLGRGAAVPRTSSDVLAALTALEERLFGPLQAYFEGIVGPYAHPLPTDTTPASLPPTADEIVAAFLNTRTVPPAARIPVTQRDVYDELRQARITRNDARFDAPTGAERALARQHLRNIFANCRGFLVAAPGTPPPPGILSPPPRDPSPLVPSNLLDTNRADRHLDIALRRLEGFIRDSRITIPDVADIGQDAFDREVARRNAARAAANAFVADTSPSLPCRAFTALANSDEVEPRHLQEADILRLKDIIDGTSVVVPLDTGVFEGYSRAIARRLYAITLEQRPAVSIDASSPSLVIRSNFSLRLAGFLTPLPVVGDDLIARVEITVRVDFVLPSGALVRDQTPEEARSNPGPSRSLRIGISPVVRAPLQEQRSLPGFAAIYVSVLMAVVGSIAAILTYAGFGAGAVAGAAGGTFILGQAGLIGLSEFLRSYQPQLGDISSSLTPFLRMIAGPNGEIPQPVTPDGTNDLIYTFDNFEASRLNLPSSGSLATPVSSVQSTLDAVAGRVRYSALWPDAFKAIGDSWASRLIRPLDVILLLPAADGALVWRPCAMILEAQSRRNDGGTDPAPLTTQVIFRATLGFAPTIASLRVLGIAFGDIDFSARVDGTTASIRSGILAGIDLNGANNLRSLPLPTMARPQEIAAGDRYVVEVTVGALAILNALGPTSAGRRVQIAFITNVGRFVADFDLALRNLRSWDALIRDARSAEATPTFDLHLAECSSATRQMRLVNLSAAQNPFPFVSLSFQDGLPLGLIDLYQPTPGDFHVVPTPPHEVGEPRPIASPTESAALVPEAVRYTTNRPWLFGAPASPVPRLDPIADLALRALRPQPVTPSA